MALSKSHAVCIPFPTQGHINPMLKLAKLLHVKGFHVTFVHTEFNYNRLLNSRGQDSLGGSNDFRFEKISDGLSETNNRGIHDMSALFKSLPIHSLSSFRDLIVKLKSSQEVPRVSCIVFDGAMSFTLKVAQEFGIPEMAFFTTSACGLQGYLHFEELAKRNYVPLKDESYLTNGYLDTEIDWIPGMRNIRLRDLPTFIRTTDPCDTMFNYNIDQVNNSTNAKGVILNTYDDLEQEVLDAIKTRYPQLYTIGPLSLLHQQLSNTGVSSIESNLWKDDTKCLDWLDKKSPRSVVYVNYGSLVTMTTQQLQEFAWGLANSNHSFLWIIRPNLINNATDILSDHYMKEISNRGMLVDWCSQERVLAHPAIGGFLAHCGWNSMLESITEGVPLICCPFFSEQQTNSPYCCTKWCIGMQVDTDVKREKVEWLVRELMEGQKGKEMNTKAMEWKKKAEAAMMPGGSSYTNFDRLVTVLREEKIEDPCAF